MVKIILIDDDAEIRRGVEEYFSSLGNDDYSIETCDFSGYWDIISDVDIIITDYRHNGVDENAGLVVVEAIKKKTFLPIIVYSGSYGSIHSSISGSGSSFLKSIEKNSTFPESFKAEIDRVISSKEFKVKQNIEKEFFYSIRKNFREYFWDIVQEHWAEFEDLEEKILERVISRKILKNLHPKYAEDGIVNPIEIYEHPIIDKEISSGAILSKDNHYYICINNDCDLTIRVDRKGSMDCKAKKVALLEIKDYSSILKTTGAEVEQQKHNSKLLNNNSEKYREGSFFFPKTFFFRGGYVDFGDVITKDINIDEGKIKLDDIGTVIARVHAPFLHRFISNFSRYYNRFGTPDIDIS